jgi:hypothetical protein
VPCPRHTTHPSVGHTPQKKKLRLKRAVGLGRKLTPSDRGQGTLYLVFRTTPTVCAYTTRDSMYQTKYTLSNPRPQPPGPQPSPNPCKCNIPFRLSNSRTLHMSCGRDSALPSQGGVSHVKSNFTYTTSNPLQSKSQQNTQGSQPQN